MITIHYKSGKKSHFVSNKDYQKMFKVIFREKNVEKGLIDIVKNTAPDELVTAVAGMVSEEARTICQRNSNTVLQQKSQEGILKFSWDSLNKELQVGTPHLLKVVSAIVSDIPVELGEKPFLHIMHSTAIALHGRFREMSVVQYLTGLVMMHGGCTYKDIERIAKIGGSVTADTMRNRMATWQDGLDRDLIRIKDEWSNGGTKKFQLVGDNWDKNIVPSYRTSVQKTISLHLFNVIGVVDRVHVEGEFPGNDVGNVIDVGDLKPSSFIPSLQDQILLKDELTFLVSSAIIQNIDQMNILLEKVYPKHFEHKYSYCSGTKTQQHILGLFDCNETKTQDVIKLLKDLSQKYVPQANGDIVEEVFFGGDRLTDERIQGAQQAMANSEKSIDRLEGFISKIEDFHRLMNFLEAICRLTYNTTSGSDRGTAYYFRNILNARNVKAEVKNSYRAYKMLYHTIFDGMCCVLFYKEFGLKDMTDPIPIPAEWSQWNKDAKIDWINNVSIGIVNKWFFEDSDDVLEAVRNVLEDPDHEENYWVSSAVDGRFRCHYCEKTYAFVNSLKQHESANHGHKIHKVPKKSPDSNAVKEDEVYNYVILLFRLAALHKNLDTAVDMADGHRSVRSAKYETPIYNKVNKTKYLIGSIHLTGLVSGTLPPQQAERLIANRCVNISGGKNNNMALDEYVEMINRDTKNACTGSQTKESIIAHSKEFPHLVDAVKHYDMICDVRKRKGFHKLPSYKIDVQKVANDLFDTNAFEEQPGRQLKCKSLVGDRNPYHGSYKNLSTMIYRHKPSLPFRRLKNKNV
ncbi:uncharacterized protein [Argopecten irradians]|uniref:uncharacterized protein n=1 Tax=Argopecten irradians TaxID=31199 RepID=UPI0037169684